MDPIHQNSVRKQKEIKLKQMKTKQFTANKPLTPYQLKKAKQAACQTWYFQSYNNFEVNDKASLPNQCFMSDIIQQQQCQQQKAYNRAQNLLNLYRMKPQQFPLTSWTYKNGLTKPQQRQYSNLWYRIQGASNACGSVQPGYPYSIYNNWPGSFIPGSQTTYTDGFNQNVPY